MTNLKRYIELQYLLDQLEQVLAINEEIDQLEREALHDGVIFIRDGHGGWETSQLTPEEKELFLTMDDDEELIIVTIGEEQVQRILSQMGKDDHMV